jgi:hypothetical protein
MPLFLLLDDEKTPNETSVTAAEYRLDRVPPTGYAARTAFNQA